MELKFILKNDVTKSQQDMIDSLNKICFGIDETILNHRRVHSPMLCIVTCFIRDKRVI
jgi:hypothetical protein